MEPRTPTCGIAQGKTAWDTDRPTTGEALSSVSEISKERECFKESIVNTQNAAERSEKMRIEERVP